MVPVEPVPTSVLVLGNLDRASPAAVLEDCPWSAPGGCTNSPPTPNTESSQLLLSEQSEELFSDGPVSSAFADDFSALSPWQHPLTGRLWVTGLSQGRKCWPGVLRRTGPRYLPELSLSTPAADFWGTPAHHRSARPHSEARRVEGADCRLN